MLAEWVKVVMDPKLTYFTGGLLQLTENADNGLVTNLLNCYDFD